MYIGDTFIFEKARQQNAAFSQNKKSAFSRISSVVSNFANFEVRIAKTNESQIDSILARLYFLLKSRNVFMILFSFYRKNLYVFLFCLSSFYPQDLLVLSGKTLKNIKFQ